MNLKIELLNHASVVLCCLFSVSGWFGAVESFFISFLFPLLKRGKVENSNGRHGSLTRTTRLDHALYLGKIALFRFNRVNDGIELQLCPAICPTRWMFYSYLLTLKEIYLSIYLSICMSVCLSVCVCLSINRYINVRLMWISAERRKECVGWRFER